MPHEQKTRCQCLKHGAITKFKEKLRPISCSHNSGGLRSTMYEPTSANCKLGSGSAAKDCSKRMADDSQDEGPVGLKGKLLQRAEVVQHKKMGHGIY